MHSSWREIERQDVPDLVDSAAMELETMETEVQSDVERDRDCTTGNILTEEEVEHYVAYYKVDLSC